MVPTEDPPVGSGTRSEPRISMVTYNRRSRMDDRQPTTSDLRLAAIVEFSEDAIVSKDLNGIIQSWNGAAERMFGYSAAEVVGQSITIIIPRERLQEETDVLARVRRGEIVDHFETVRRRKDGSTLDISLTVSPIKAPDGRIVGASKIARDITIQNRLRRELEHANRLKDEFLATLSHELRTPLNAILGYARMLQSQALPDERANRSIQIIERNAASLSQLVADVLDLSRIVAGKVRLNVQPCDLPTLVNNAIDAVRPAVDAKGIELNVILDPNAAPVSGDPDRLQQVVWNLLSNAVKFTPKRGRVQVQLARINSHVELTVSDTGIGIEPVFIPHLFERFRQVDSGYTREHGGLGLGLALVRHFIELHGGTVHGTSEGIGRGATFRVELPLRIVHAPQEPAEERVHPLAGGRPPEHNLRLDGIVALTIDDDADSLTLLGDILRHAGAAVIAARSAIEALDVLGHQRPDVIVADIGLPRMNGYDFIREVRRRETSMDDMVPAAALTAFARSEDRAHALMAGFQMHLAKPIDPLELVAAIAALTNRTRVAQADRSAS
jgi:PAS domain S-box-containing protein